MVGLATFFGRKRGGGDRSEGVRFRQNPITLLAWMLACVGGGGLLKYFSSSSTSRLPYSKISKSGAFLFLFRSLERWLQISQKLLFDIRYPNTPLPSPPTPKNACGLR